MATSSLENDCEIAKEVELYCKFLKFRRSISKGLISSSYNQSFNRLGYIIYTSKELEQFEVDDIVNFLNQNLFELKNEWRNFKCVHECVMTNLHNYRFYVTKRTVSNIITLNFHA